MTNTTVSRDAAIDALSLAAAHLPSLAGLIRSIVPIDPKTIDTIHTILNATIANLDATRGTQETIALVRRAEGEDQHTIATLTIEP